MSDTISRACPTKSRNRAGRRTRGSSRWTEQLVAIVAEMKPIGIRGVFYQCVKLAACWRRPRRTSTLVERRLLMLRRAGRVPVQQHQRPGQRPDVVSLL